MRSIPDLTVVCAADANALRAVLRASVDHPGAMYIRLGRGRDPEVYPEVPPGFRFGRAERLRDGRDVTIIATGTAVRPALDAAEALAGEGIGARVLDMHTIKPLDAEAVAAAAAETGAILTVEEHYVTGGLGSAVAERLAGDGAAQVPPPRRAGRVRAGRAAGGALRALPAGRAGHRGGRPRAAGGVRPQKQEGE